MIQEIEEALYRYGTLREQAREIEDEMKELAAKKLEMVDSMLRSPVLDAVRVQGGKAIDPVYDVVQKMVDVYDEQIRMATMRLHTVYVEYERIQDAIEAAKLTAIEKKYLQERYVNGRAHKVIAREIGYSERQIGRIRTLVMNKMAGIV